MKEYERRPWSPRLKCRSLKVGAKGSPRGAEGRLECTSRVDADLGLFYPKRGKLERAATQREQRVKYEKD